MSAVKASPILIVNVKLSCDKKWRLFQKTRIVRNLLSEPIVCEGKWPQLGRTLVSRYRGMRAATWLGIPIRKPFVPEKGLAQVR